MMLHYFYMRENTQSRQSRLTLAVRQNSGSIFLSQIQTSKTIKSYP